MPRWTSARTTAACLIARPSYGGFRVIDAFSRIVRLGEGLSHSGRLSEAAIERTLEALRICRDKMRTRGVTRARLIATEACRSASNGAEFLARVRDKLGLHLEIVDRETEAYLAAAGCGELIDESAKRDGAVRHRRRLLRDRLDDARRRRRAQGRRLGIACGSASFRSPRPSAATT